MALGGDVEAAKTIAGQRVRTALQHDCGWRERLHHLRDHRLEHAFVRFVGDTAQQREVDRVVLAVLGANVFDVARTREEVTVFVERDRHHAIRHVKGFFHAVSVVDVNVNVQDTWVVLEQFEDAEHDVVDVAEARAFRLFGVVQPARPVDRDIAEPMVQANSGVKCSARVNAAKVIDSIKDRAVRELTEVELLKVGAEVLLVDWVHTLEEIDVVGRVECLDLLARRPVRFLEDVHLAVEVVVDDELMREFEAMWLHGVARSIVEVAFVRVVEVGHASLDAPKVGHVDSFLEPLAS